MLQVLTMQSITINVKRRKALQMHDKQMKTCIKGATEVLTMNNQQREKEKLKKGTKPSRKKAEIPMTKKIEIPMLKLFFLIRVK